MVVNNRRNISSFRKNLVVFSDGELEALKIRLQLAPDTWFQALIKRFEAAELCADFLTIKPELNKVDLEAIEAWHKVCGK